MADDGGAIGSSSTRRDGAGSGPPLPLLLAGALVALLALLIVAVGLNDDNAGGVFDGDDEAEVVGSGDAEGAPAKVAAAPSTTVPAEATTTVPAEGATGAAAGAEAAEEPEAAAECPDSTVVGATLFTDIESLVSCEVDVTVTVSGVLDDRTFAIKEYGGEVVVMDTSEGQVLDPGQSIRIIGVVDVFHFDELAETLGLEADDEEVYSRFEGKALVLAESTRPA